MTRTDFPTEPITAASIAQEADRDYIRDQKRLMRELDAQNGPWKVVTDFQGDDWLIGFGHADIGEVHITTDSVRASETNGADAMDDALFMVWCRNNWQLIKAAVEAYKGPRPSEPELRMHAGLAKVLDAFMVARYGGERSQ